MNLLKRFRSSRTGRYVTPAEAKANEDTTVSETHTAMLNPSDGIPIIALIALRRSIRTNGLDNTIERLVD
jgi:hypothetical protein